MICKGLRHIGVVSKLIDAATEYYEKLGFAVVEAGRDNINGREVIWRKLSDGLDTIELLNGDGFEDHLSFTVDEVDTSKYYYIAPSGHRIQYGRDPSGKLIEYVEERRSKIEKT